MTAPLPQSGAPGAPHNGRPPAIQLDGVSRSFGNHQAVTDVSAEIADGHVLGLIGPNGAGKTTTIRMMAGLLAPTDGTVRLLGQVLEGRAVGRLHRAVGYMPDFFGVYEDMVAWEYLDFFARCHGVGRARRPGLVDELLDLVGLADKRGAPVDGLSRGMQQRLCLAQSLVHDPPILLLDEPASGLDPRVRLEMRELLKELKRLGKTIVISSHILADLEHLCDSIGIMDEGRLIASGTVAEIGARRRGATEIRMRFMGNDAAALALLDTQPAVEVLDAFAAPAADNPSHLGDEAVVTFLVDGGPEMRADILAALISSGIRVTSFAEEGTRLEEVFMRLTGRAPEDGVDES